MDQDRRPEPAPGPGLSSLALAHLRQAAALAHADPVLRLRLRDGDRVLLSVTAPGAAGAGGVRWLSPCAFRAAVVDAWIRACSGQAVGMHGVVGGDPAVDVGVPPGGATHDGGVHRWSEAGGRSWRWAVALTGSAATAEQACTELDDDRRGWPLRDVRLRDDPALGCCVLRATTDAAPELAEPVAALLADVAARHAVLRLLESAARPASAPFRRRPGSDR